MKGRLEHTIKADAKIRASLVDAPGYLKNYETHLEASKKEAGTRATYIRIAIDLIRSINADISSVTTEDITAQAVEAYMAGTGTKTLRDGTRAETTYAYQRLVHTALNDFCNYLLIRKLIPENPMATIARPSARDDIKRIRLTVDDLQGMIGAVDTGAGSDIAVSKQIAWQERDTLILKLFIATGVRKTALSEINVEDVDLDSGTITVLDKRRKTMIYHIDSLIPDIQAWLTRREEILDGKTCDALFISNRKSRISPRAVEEVVVKYARAGTDIDKRISPHKLRAAYCTVLYETTHDIELVRRAVGHSSTEITKRYIVQGNSAQEQAAEIMAGLIGNTNNTQRLKPDHIVQDDEIHVKQQNLL